MRRIGALMVIVASGIAFVAAATEGRGYNDGEAAFVRGDFTAALQIWRPLADAGDAKAQFGLGNPYLRGGGVARDLTQSTRWYRLSAEQGFAPAQFNLGNAYFSGRGVSRDNALAVEWWRRAAIQGLASAQFNLGMQYQLGRGVAKDPDHALDWFRRAADGGHQRAREMLMKGDAAPHRQTRLQASGAESRRVSPGAGESRSADARANRQTQWIRDQPPDRFTIQIIADTDRLAISEFMARHRLGEDAALFAFDREGSRWYAVVSGSYRSRAEADRAIAALPPAFIARRPWVRQFARIQALMLP